MEDAEQFPGHASSEGGGAGFQLRAFRIGMAIARLGSGAPPVGVLTLRTPPTVRVEFVWD